MKKALLAAAMVSAVFVVTASAQKTGGAEIFSKLEHQLDDLRDYSVNLKADVAMEGLRVPRMKAKLSFKQPDKIHFEAEGFAMMPREGFGVTPAALAKKFTAGVVGKESVGGIDAIRVRCIPRNDSIPDHNLVIWVDPVRWVILKIETTPYQGRTMTLVATFTKVRDRWWLPATMKMEMNGGGAPDQNETPPGTDRQSGRQQRQPKKGTIDIEYSGYSVNQNLPDSLFEKNTALRK